MSLLKDTLTKQTHTAMKAKAKERLATLRAIMAEIKRLEIDKRIDPSDDDIIAIMVRMVKQRNDSITAFNKANRDDLVAIEQAELLIIQEFLPKAFTEAEITQLIEQALTETQATSPKDMGKVMTWLKPRCTGKADMKQLSATISKKLAQL